MLGATIPVDPDAATARQWLRDELTNPVYHDGPSLLERFIAWLRGLLDGVSLVGLSGTWSAIAVVAVALLLAGVALYVAGPVRGSRRPRTAPGVLDDDLRTAVELDAAAAAAAARGDFTAATLDAFRALVRGAEDRVLLDPRPGRTAHEAAQELAPRFPDLTTPLAEAAAVFDALCYGTTSADAGTYDAMAALGRTVSSRRPAALTDRRVLVS